MGRTTKNQRGASGGGGGSKAETPPTTSQQQQYETALYSREDIREQYSINKKETDPKIIKSYRARFSRYKPWELFLMDIYADVHY
jgi:hypothetical protein